MKYSHCSVAALILCLSGHLYAQENTPPLLPPGPLIQTRAPDMSQWVISTKILPSSTELSTIGAAKEEAKGPSKIVVITKTGKIINTLIVDQDRHYWSVWNAGSLHLLVSPDGKQIGQAARPTDPDAVNPFYLDYSQTDFPGFEWLSTTNFSDIKSYQGTPCLIFKKAGHLAYIEEDNRLPIALVDGEGVHMYQFRAAPTAMQKLPDNVEQFLLNEQHHVESMANRQITPY